MFWSLPSLSARWRLGLKAEGKRIGETNDRILLFPHFFNVIVDSMRFRIARSRYSFPEKRSEGFELNGFL